MPKRKPHDYMLIGLLLFIVALALTALPVNVVQSLTLLIYGFAFIGVAFVVFGWYKAATK